MLVNLAVNARDAMPQGGRLVIATGTVAVDEVACSAHSGARPGRYLFLGVRDNGLGIPADAIEHVFGPFFTTREFGRGTGLGLSTVYGIVQQGGGFIDLASAPGQGACFRLHFPAVAAPLRAPGRPAPGLPPAGCEHVLLAEDDPVVRDLAARALGDLGYHVHAAGSSAEALEYASGPGRTIDLLPADVIMPGMSGRELHERLREHWPRMTVI